MNKIYNWYKINLGKILLLSIILIFFTVTVKFIPYFNFLFSSEVGFPIIFIAWHLLFRPSTRLLVFIAWGILSLAFMSSYFQLDIYSSYLGDFLYLELLLILVNYMITAFKDRNSTSQ